MTPEAWVLSAIGLAITTLGTVAVFRKGAGDSIDHKRETEIARLDARLTIVEHDASLTARVAYRAMRYIERLPDAPAFDVTDEELEAIERTRPLVN